MDCRNWRGLKGFSGDLPLVRVRRSLFRQTEQPNGAATLQGNGQSEVGTIGTSAVEINGQSDERGNGAAPIAESHAPAAPTDDVVEPPVEAL